jgi:hypothetical protein
MKRLLLVLAVIGCGKSDADWTSKKLVAQTVELEGVSFSIDIPEGLPKSKRDPGDWSDARVESDHVPKVFTRVYPLDMPATVEDAMGEASLRPKEATFIRKDQRPDGWALTDANPDKHRIEASTLKRLGDKIIKCTAVQVGDGALPSYDKTRAMLEAICDSVRAK